MSLLCFMLCPVLASGDVSVDSTADVIFGCDGAFSAVRRAMMKKSGFNFNFSQEFIPHDYLELCILPTEDEEVCCSNYI